MSNDALERLKQRQRPKVPTRDINLTSTNTDTSASRYLDSAQPQQDTPLASEQLEAKPLHCEIEPIQTKQSTLRLEAQLSDRLSAVCRDNGISREVLLEALFQHYELDPEAWKVILTEAKKRGEQRQQLANFRRAQSMMQRFGAPT